MVEFFCMLNKCIIQRLQIHNKSKHRFVSGITSLKKKLIGLSSLFFFFLSTLLDNIQCNLCKIFFEGFQACWWVGMSCSGFLLCAKKGIYVGLSVLMAYRRAPEVGSLILIELL